MADKNNKINFYLIKDGLTLDEVFKAPLSDLETVNSPDGSNIYYNPKQVVTAPWVNNFFKTNFLDSNNRSIFNAASSQAVLIKTITLKNKNITFAICFGTGYHMLNKDSYEPKFGLYSVLNIVNENSLRKIDKHDISGTPKYTAEQLSKKGGQIDFGIDFELDILLGITGSLDKKDKRENRLIQLFGTTLSGKSNLNINARFDIDNIERLLKSSYIAFKSDRYKSKGFDWIDKIDLIKRDSLLHEALEKELSDNLKNRKSNPNHIWLAVPELIEWQDICGFYFANKKDDIFSDVTFDAFEEVIEGEINTEKLRSISVNALHADEEKIAYSWNAYQCLYAEVKYRNETYILINSEWYKLKGNFVQETNRKYQDILTNHASALRFKDYEAKDKNENGYNANMTRNIAGAVCMDAKNISHGGRYDKIEFCDIFDVNNKKIIHVKHYSGSSVLSHLFSQGYVSAELLLNDAEFKTKVESEILKQSGSPFLFNDIDGYEVVFGIIAKPNMTEIPIFSKINLNSVFNRIKNMRGYTASIAFIPNKSDLKIKEAA